MKFVWFICTVIWIHINIVLEEVWVTVKSCCSLSTIHIWWRLSIFSNCFEFVTNQRPIMRISSGFRIAWILTKCHTVIKITVLLRLSKYISVNLSKNLLNSVRCFGITYKRSLIFGCYWLAKQLYFVWRNWSKSRWVCVKINISSRILYHIQVTINFIILNY